MNMITGLTLFSAISFIFFGGACLLTSQMKSEFERYGLASFRRIVGWLQLVGGFALLVGMLYLPVLQPIVAGGLSVLMLMGFLVRLKIKDSFTQAAPSFCYALLNAYIFYILLPLF